MTTYSLETMFHPLKSTDCDTIYVSTHYILGIGVPRMSGHSLSLCIYIEVALNNSQHFLNP